MDRAAARPRDTTLTALHHELERMLAVSSSLRLDVSDCHRRIVGPLMSYRDPPPLSAHVVSVWSPSWRKRAKPPTNWLSPSSACPGWKRSLRKSTGFWRAPMRARRPPSTTSAWPAPAGRTGTGWSAMTAFDSARNAERTSTTCPAWPGRRRKPSSKEKRRPASVSSESGWHGAYERLPRRRAPQAKARRRGGGDQPAAGGSAATRDDIGSVTTADGAAVDRSRSSGCGLGRRERGKPPRESCWAPCPSWNQTT
jgi:hypothetical protein